MPRKIVATDQAPKAIGPYSQAVDTGDLVFLSGQIPLDPVTQQMVTGDAAEQTDRVLKNIQGVLKAVGLGFEHVAKASVFLTDLADFAKMNEVYARYFTQEPPARSTFQVAALPRGARVEIEIVARRG